MGDVIIVNSQNTAISFVTLGSCRTTLDIHFFMHIVIAPWTTAYCQLPLSPFLDLPSCSRSYFKELDRTCTKNVGKPHNLTALS